MTSYVSEPLLWGVVVSAFILLLALVILSMTLTAWGNYTDRRRLRERELVRKRLWEDW